MSLVARSTSASPETGSIMRTPQIIGIANADIDIAAPCYIMSTGKIAMANGTAADALARVVGFSVRKALAGEPVTLHGEGSIFHYSDTDLTPGAVLYLGATAGRLDTAATTGDAVGVAFVMPDKKTIMVNI